MVVVVKGPTQSILVREKEKVAGIWVNAAQLRYRSAPSFYAIASSRPIERWSTSGPAPSSNSGSTACSSRPRPTRLRRSRTGSAAGWSTCKRRAGLYYEAPRAVEITDGVLYRARVTIPARVPVGNFTAETFLIRDGRVLAAAVRDIDIRKSGFERFVARAADRSSSCTGWSRWPCRWGSAGSPAGSRGRR